MQTEHVWTTLASIGGGFLALAAGVLLLYILSQKRVLAVDRDRLARDGQRVRNRFQRWTASPWSAKKGLVIFALLFAAVFTVSNPPVLLVLLVFGWLYYRPGKESPMDAASAPVGDLEIHPKKPLAAAMGVPPTLPATPFRVRPGFQRPFPERMWMKRQRPTLFRRMARGVGVLFIIGMGLGSLAFLCGDWSKEFADGDSPRFARRLAEIFEDSEESLEELHEEGVHLFNKPYLAGEEKSPAERVRKKVEARLQKGLDRAKKAMPQIRPITPAPPATVRIEAQRLANEARLAAANEPPVVVDVDRPAEELLSHPRLILKSNPWPSEADGVQEIVDRVVAFLPQAVEAHDENARVVDWTPSPRWVRRHLLTGQKTLPEEPGEAGQKLRRVQMELSLLPDNLDVVYKRYRVDHASERTFLLAKTYAGSVMIVGGLAIFTRLGTGRRRPE